MNVYINLAVSDLPRSRAFFTALGFSFNEAFSDGTAAALVINESVGAMLLTREKFASFTPRRLADPQETSEVLVALQLDDREAVDRMVASALANGGSAVREPEDHGFMYGHSFADPDGHIFEPFVMDMSQVEAAQ